MIKNWIFLILFFVGIIWTVLDLFKVKNFTGDSKQIKSLYKEYKILVLAIFIYLVFTYIDKIFF
ncbi:hypothetical protein SAMN05444405_104169 [Bacteroides luti]|uniref:Uncharacterized protein n=1 Tax=Bacteroides luti TaxID=1297750 RepID=A0A1M4XZ72_9BACE|nr:hypothetical protein SAMN05444405_104169 [Bacteroides luti]